MKIALDQIVVDEDIRIRKDVGDLKSLEDSISKVGLINPVLIDEQNNLLAGYRRYTACKSLGMEEIEVTVIEVGDDKMKVLDVEVAENFFRKDFTPEEVILAERRRQEIIEATRKKGVIERIWLGFKGLFGSGSKEKKVAPAPQQDVQSQQVADTATQPEQKTKVEEVQNIQKEAPAAVEQSVKASPEDDVHSIKWRNS